MIKNKIPFLLFFISGFCGLLYQVIWLRLALRSFGVITPVLSVVIAVFMLGLALGSWAGGKWITNICKKTKLKPIYNYAIAELLIGVGAFIVPFLFTWFELYLDRFGEMDSFMYLFLSALLIAASILPWCILMGVTFPFMMAHIKENETSETTSFSFLYLANVIGAMCGTLITAFVLIELWGFHTTLFFAGCANFLIAIISYGLGKITQSKQVLEPEEVNAAAAAPEGAGFYISVLFITGFTSMGLEVVWTRAFTPVLYTTVYAFAALVSVYLFATWVGSFVYRRDVKKDTVRSNSALLIALGVCAFIPVILNDPRIHSNKILLLLSIFPFCALLGYLTPKLIDVYSGGQPKPAGRAYAINIIGCILGPLVASYLFLPAFGSKVSMALLALPYVIMIFWYRPGAKTNQARAITNFSAKTQMTAGVIAAGLFLFSVFINIGYEDRFKTYNFSRDGVIRRDHTATIISHGEGMRKRLFVNGVSITILTPITKLMAHLPLAMLEHKPESALVICFGMGTTYRSLMSWPIDVTAVELVPSVKDAFGYYYDDAEELLNDPRGHVIIDDGRRYLRRTDKKFDVITIDPPPPVTAAGSSLLYSRDFYEIVKARLTKGGIMHHWVPGGDKAIYESITSAIADAFPYVIAFNSIEGWGVHYIASMEPISIPSIETLQRRIPPNALYDMVEWAPHTGPYDMLVNMFTKRSMTTEYILNFVETGNDYMVTDDRPVTEYYMLRAYLDKDNKNYIYK